MTQGAPTSALSRYARSIGAKLLVVLVLFLIVPAVLYGRFQAADGDRRAFMLESVRSHGSAIAQALANDLGRPDADVFSEVPERLQLFETPGMRLRLLFSPADEKDVSDFFYVATAPAFSMEQLELERRLFRQTGLLSDVWSSCSGMVELSRVTAAPEVGRELLVSITPIQTAQGCWALIASLALEDQVAASLIEPYWQRPEVIAAVIIYVAMASVLIVVLLDVRGALRRFERHARRIAAAGSGGRSFRRLNRVPELDGVAGEFDAMVQRLHDVAVDIRASAEEQVHALKTPIGTIAQSIEALRRAVPPDNARAHRMLGIIDQSRQRLSSLIVAGQRTTEAAALLASPPRDPVQIDELLRGLCGDFDGPCEARGIHLHAEIMASAVVLGSDEMLEAVFENVIENAVGFSPKGATVSVHLERAGRNVRISVRDSGPGASEDVLAKLFEKGFTRRPASAVDEGGGGHFGLGMWIVSRNVVALNGSVSARNADPCGLEVTIVLPIAENA
ncbi:MAG: HAMP domain-containing sensor histidine kinase [Thalassobaculaceae bacterium]|nr:HAMP domain-containing sensor histidine kinase [Thalassobaculaceae bacterium]